MFQIVELLLTNDVNINVVDKYNATPLHRAAVLGRVPIVQLLIDQGENLLIDMRDSIGNTAL